ncbi:MAG: GAF domain-containing protein [Firmicutes bacterium]|nr:GAF domain-containing protein [Bacillota bacterium]
MTGDAADRERLLISQVKHLIEGERDPIANLANVSALLWMSLEDVNWVGFYLRKGDELVLGPFQGKPACVRIRWGQGVCGTAAATASVQLVTDVSQFPGHIACDAASRSEVVVPLVVGDRVIGVLDIDSPSVARFSTVDERTLQAVVDSVVAGTDFVSA